MSSLRHLPYEFWYGVAAHLLFGLVDACFLFSGIIQSWLTGWWILLLTLLILGPVRGCAVALYGVLRGLRRPWFASIGLGLAALVVLSTAYSPLPLLISFLAYSFATAAFAVAATRNLEQKVPASLHSRAIAISYSTRALSSAAAAILYAFRYGYNPTLPAIPVFLALATLLPAAVPIREGYALSIPIVFAEPLERKPRRKPPITTSLLLAVVAANCLPLILPPTAALLQPNPLLTAAAYASAQLLLFIPERWLLPLLSTIGLYVLFPIAGLPGVTAAAQKVAPRGLPLRYTLPSAIIGSFLALSLYIHPLIPPLLSAFLTAPLALRYYRASSVARASRMRR